MSHENVEIVRKGFDAFNAFVRGELSREAYAELCAELWDPQIELHWHDQRTYPDSPQDLRGAPELISFAEQFRDGWVDLVWEPLELVEAPGDRVLTTTRQSGRGRQSGVPIKVHFFQVFTIRDGLVHKIEYFRHRADALETAGQRE
jgi:ketosteroid isomerase-like protein